MSNSDSRVDAVIFDWAGTVVDFGSRGPAGGLLEMFRRHGVTALGDAPLSAPRHQITRHMQ